MLARLALLRGDAVAGQAPARPAGGVAARSGDGVQRALLPGASPRCGWASPRAGASCCCRSCRRRARPGRVTRRWWSCAARSRRRLVGGRADGGAGAVGRLRARRPRAREGVCARAGDGARRRRVARCGGRGRGGRRPSGGWRGRCWARRRPLPCARRGTRRARRRWTPRPAAARRAMGFEDAQPQAQGAGDAGRLGLAIALTGKFQPVGEAAMRAAMLAVGLPASGDGGAGGGAARRSGDAALRPRHRRRARAREQGGRGAGARRGGDRHPGRDRPQGRRRRRWRRRAKTACRRWRSTTRRRARPAPRSG